MYSFTGPRALTRGTWMLAALASAVLLLWRPVAAAGLTLDDVMHEALARNHDLAAARAQVDAARGRLQQAGLWPNPRLEFSGDTDRPFANEGEYARSIGISQQFPITARLARAQDVARVDVARALAEVNEAERKLLGDIAMSFYEIVALDQKIELRKRLISIVEALVTVSADRQKAGEVSELDVNTAMLELERLHQEHILLSGERAVTLKTLAGLVGFAPESSPAIDATLPPIAAPPPLAQLTDQALTRRPDLRLLALAADRAQAEQVLAQAAAWEDWSVSLGVQQDRLRVTGAPAQSADGALMLSLSVPLPLFNRNQGSRAAAVADALTAREQFAALQLRIENEVAGRHEQVTQLLTALNAYRERTLPLSRRNTDLARDVYRQGQLSIVDVVLAERQENDLNTGYADTLAQYLRALAELNSAAAANANLMTHAVVTSADPPGEN